MGIVAAYAVPHPPLIVPAVGKGEERGISSTVAAYEEVARRIAAHRPDTVVVTSPHAPLYRDAFFVSAASELPGSMLAFGAPEERLAASMDVELARAIRDEAAGRGLPVAFGGRGDEQLDHGTYVPLSFIRDLLDDVRIVRVGLSWLPYAAHRELGGAIASAVAALGRRAVFVASGDLSHKLKEDGPYGFAPEGPEFDREIARIFESGDLDALFAFDEGFCERAAECGLRSFQIMAGSLEGLPVSSELLSCEGPFGVGYGVGAFEVAPSGGGLHAEPSIFVDGVDPYVALARASVERYVREGSPLAVPADAPEELARRRAGVFVSLHIGDRLRGCIGTIGPAYGSIAEEIVNNGIAAATDDPRFSPVTPAELELLSYSVDVLAPAEPIESEAELDPARYGVIVTKGWRRGLLLPALDGIDTAAYQVEIAKRKAGIDPCDADVELERFEVVRHDRGGEARDGS